MSDDEHQDNEADEIYLEQARLGRAVRFVGFILIFYPVMLFLDYEHETILMIIAAGGFLLWVLYMVIVICALGCTADQPIEAEERGLTIRSDDESGSFNFSIKDTPTQIRSCQDEINPDEAPKDGLYEIVYNAVFFGKSLRTQGMLQLTFKKDKANSGWYISGESKSAAGSRPISEGFINAYGQMYWIINDDRDLACTYRGAFDFTHTSMFDGEFQSRNHKANGRIVRMEWVKDDDLSLRGGNESSEETGMEMVSLPSEANSIV